MVVLKKPSYQDVGKLFIRLAVGGLMLFHGAALNWLAMDSSKFN